MNKLISINCEWTKSRTGPRRVVHSSSSKNPSAFSPLTNPDNKSPKNPSLPKLPNSTSSKKSETCAKRSSTLLKPSNPKISSYCTKNTVVRPIHKHPLPSSTSSVRPPSITIRIKYLGSFWKWKRTKIRTRKISSIKTLKKAKKIAMNSRPWQDTFTRKSKRLRTSLSKIILDCSIFFWGQNFIIFTSTGWIMLIK